MVAEKEHTRDWRACPEAVCGGGGSDKSPITVANGNHTIPGRSPRAGVTSDEAENAPRLRVLYGEDGRSLNHHWGHESRHTPPALRIANPGSLAMAFSRRENKGVLSTYASKPSSPA